MTTLLHVVLARIRGAFRQDKHDREFDREIKSHLDMSVADKLRRGMTPKQARRAARMELGGLTQLRESGREARGLPWLDPFWLDIKLGLRMLRRSWGLTLVGGLAMTIVIFIAGFAYQFLHTLQGSQLPLDEGDRVVAMLAWDPVTNDHDGVPLEDFEQWRSSLQSVEDIGAFRNVERSLVTADGLSEPVAIAQISAAGFGMARVPPLLGRPLIAEDEQDNASPVVVIGADLWQSRFLSDAGIVGQDVNIGGTPHTVVGVMPKGFGFPVNHRMWTPLRLDRVADAATELFVFGRLAPGASFETAQAELAIHELSQVATAVPEELQPRPRVMPYTFAFMGAIQSGQGRWVVRVILFLVTLLLVPPCTNIAILVYARTITRHQEFAARTALGASRRRIVVQIFIEVLVLAGTAAVAALVLAFLAIGFVRDSLSLSGESFVGSGGAPFWMDFSLSFTTVAFAAGLAVFAAVIAGAIPALKATGSQMQSGLRALGGGGTGMRLGATWTTLVVVQVAISMAALPTAVEMGWGTIRTGILGPGFAAQNYMTARIALDQESDTSFGMFQADLVRRLEAEPGVLGVTLAAAVAGEEPWGHVEIEGALVPEDGIFETNNLTRFNHVDASYFETFAMAPQIGREFDVADFEVADVPVIVNERFARLLLGDASPVGRRIRFLDAVDALPGGEPGRWHEIVGVVPDVPANVTHGTVYFPEARRQMESAYVMLHVGPTVSGIGGRIVEIGRALDPTLRVDELVTLGEVYRDNQIGNNIGALGLSVVTLSVLLLSAAGMYALMSFTVNQRRREIGIRSALGAQPRRLLAGIFRRVLRQLGIGAAVGVSIAFVIDRYIPIELVGGWNVPAIVPAAAVIMIAIGLSAAFGPARRGLRVEPTEALRNG